MSSFLYTEKESGENGSSDFSMAINDFLFSLNIDNINLIKLHQYIKESNIMHKVIPYYHYALLTHFYIIVLYLFFEVINVFQVSSYGDKVASLQKGTALDGVVESGKDGSILSSFRALADMLLSLTTKDGDGRIIISRTNATCSGKPEGYIKYVMLTGEMIFSEVC